MRGERSLAERLLALQAEQFPVWDRKTEVYRPFRFDDAAILFRSTTSLPLYEEQFKAAGLPYLTVCGRGYYDRPEVRDLVALLKCLYAPGDDLSLAAVLRSPLFNLSDETLYRLRWRGPEDAALAEPAAYGRGAEPPPPTDQPDEVTFAAETLAVLWGMAGRVNVWQLLRAALDRTGYEAALALSDAGAARRRDRPGDSSNVAKFLALARERGGASLSDFLRRVEDLRQREAREGEAPAGAPDTGAVKLMTVHAAKGLEYPVVVVADLGRKPGRRTTRRASCTIPSLAWSASAMPTATGSSRPVTCGPNGSTNAWNWPKAGGCSMSPAPGPADLLILSGKPGEAAILAGCPDGRLGVIGGWQRRYGDAEGWLQHPPALPRTACWGRLRPQARRPRRWPGGDASARETALFPVTPRPIAVTHLERRLAEEAGELPVLRPAAMRGRDGRPPGRAPRYLVGNLAHRALADWDGLGAPPDELRGEAGSWAQRLVSLNPMLWSTPSDRCWPRS